MGKKGKKGKGKVTGTPDVVKFKTTGTAFMALTGVVAMYESLPEVKQDMLSPADYKRMYKFFSMLGSVAEMTKVEGPDGNKNYRFQLHHPYLYPTPQYNPIGYRVDLIERSRKVVDAPALKYNGKSFPWTRWTDLNLIQAADTFLATVDKMSMSIPSFVQDQLPDFTGGLKKFKYDILDRMHTFDKMWTAQEALMMKVWLDVHEEVFEPVSLMISIEADMSQTEKAEDMLGKQKLETEFVQAIEVFYNLVYPQKPGHKPEPWPEEVIPLAEACVFYETKCSEEWLNLCRHLIKVYIELRGKIAAIPAERMHPEYLKNEELCRVLVCFQKAVADATEPLAFAAGLPRIGNFKKEQWMTREALEPEVTDLNATGHLIKDVMLPPEEPE